MAKKKNTISDPPKTKRDYHKLKELTLADGSRVKERYHNDKGSKPVYPKPKKDPEAEEEPSKEGPVLTEAEKKFMSPRRDPVFKKYWRKFIDNVVGRDSFKEGHLSTLEVLCDLYVEYQSLSATIRTEGQIYETVTQWGKTKKMHPAVSQREKVRANIAKYTKMLDLFPKKDSGGGSEGEEEAWS